MPARSPPRASVFGAVDSDSFDDGLSLHAHTLRALQMGANRIATRPEPMLSLAWDSSGDGTEANVKGLRAGYLQWDQWTVAIPGPIRVAKPTNADRMDVRMFVHLGGASGAQTAHVRVDTMATEQIAPTDLTSGNVVAITSSANTIGNDAAPDVRGWVWTEIDGVPCTPGLDYELITVAIKGSPTNTATTGHGTATGPVGVYKVTTRQLSDAGATFNTSGSVFGDDGKHVVLFTDPTTNAPMFDPVRIAGALSATELLFAHPIPLGRALWITGRPATWTVYDLNPFRIAGLTCSSSLVDL